MDINYQQKYSHLQSVCKKQ